MTDSPIDPSQELSDLIHRPLSSDSLGSMVQLLRTVIDNLSEGFVLADEHGCIIEWNRAAEQIYGLKRADALNHKLWDLQFQATDAEKQTPEYYEALKTRYRESYATGNFPGLNQTAETEFCRPDGTRGCVLSSVFTIRTAAGFVIGSFARDITAARQAEETLRRQAEQLAGLNRASQAVIAALKLDQAMTSILALAREITGADHARVTLMDKEGALCHSIENPPGGTPPPQRIRPRGITNWVIHNRQPLIVDAIAPDGTITPRLPDGAPLIANPSIIETGTQSFACIPVLDKDHLRAVLHLFSPQPGVFHDMHTLLNTFANEITISIENTRLHDQLDAQDRYITRIVESIPSSLVVIDRGLRVVSANRNFIEKARRETRMTLGQKVEVVFPHVLLAYTHLDQKIQQVFHTGQTIDGGKVAYRAPGLPTRVYYYRLIPLKTDEVVENVLLLMDDITDREQLGEEVRRASRHLVSVVECANDLVISLDPRGFIVTWNQAAENISGLKAEQVKEQALLSLCAAGQRPVMAEMLRKLARGEDVKNTEISLLTITDQEVPITWNCSPMRDDAGSVVGIVAVGRDLTEQHQMEVQLIQSAKMASLGVMAGGIAHELRNPLGIVSASAQLLLEHPDDAQLRGQGLEKITAAAQRASLIIENLLKFARPQDSHTRQVDVHAALDETLNLLDHQMALQKVTLQKELSPKLPEISANPDMLIQVFTNLILNACNAMPQGGVLTVITRSRGPSEVEIGFRDSGRGIAAEDLHQIFDPFFTTMPVGKGTGLGLSISYSIVRQHKGTIDVESQPGQGSTFTIRLPVAG